MSSVLGGLRFLREDIRRTWEYGSGGWLRRIVFCLRAPGVHAVVVYRFGQSIRRSSIFLRVLLEPIYILSNALLQIVWGIELPRSVKAGPGLYIGHFGGITLSPSCELGSFCNLSQGITIGLGGSGDRLGVPTIGDYVYVAPGARIFGKITVGSHVKIGANAVVYRDIPSGSVVVLDPGFRIIKTNAT